MMTTMTAIKKSKNQKKFQQNNKSGNVFKQQLHQKQTVLQTEILPLAVPAITLCASAVNWIQLTDTGSRCSDRHHSVSPVSIHPHTHVVLVTSFHQHEMEANKQIKQAVVEKHNKPCPRVAHRGITRFLGIDQKCNQVVPWSLHTFPKNFMQIGPAVCS